jgi:hypothetical protein
VENATMKNGKAELSLDQRIAAALKEDPEHSSDFLAGLLDEIDTAIDDCDQTSREGRAASIDPTRLDGAAHRAKAEDAEFMASRYRAGEARLKNLHAMALAKEYEERWNAEADDIELAVVRAADELLERYTPLTSWLVEFLTRKTALDKEVARINSAAPTGTSRRLKEVELIARNIEGYGASQPLEKHLRLPALVVDSTAAAPLLWPLPVQFSVGLVQGLFPANGSVRGPTPGSVLRFDLTDDGRIIGIGHNGEVLSEVAVNAPSPPPLHPEMSLREQALAEEGERAAVAAQHAEAGRAREAERQRLSDKSHNEEMARRAAAISR